MEKTQGKDVSFQLGHGLMMINISFVDLPPPHFASMVCQVFHEIRLEINSKFSCVSRYEGTAMHVSRRGRLDFFILLRNLMLTTSVGESPFAKADELACFIPRKNV